MCAVTLVKWSPGFVANRLIAVLREHKISLAEAHQMTSQFVEGRRISVLFDDESSARRFVEEVEPLGVEIVDSATVATAS